MIFQLYAATKRRSIAIATGISFCMIAIFALLGYGFFFSKFYIPGNASATTEIIRHDPWMLRWFIFFFLIALVFDLVVAWLLYHYFKQTSEIIASLCAWSRLVYTAIFGAAFLPLLMALRAIEQIDTPPDSVLFYLNSFDSMWSLALIICGLHLLILGWLTRKRREVPRIWSAITLLAGCLYCIHHSLNLLWFNYGTIKNLVEQMISLPMALGELGLAGWLIVKGGK
jgi:hypothetical protein